MEIYLKDTNGIAHIDIGLYKFMRDLGSDDLVWVEDAGRYEAESSALDWWDNRYDQEMQFNSALSKLSTTQRDEVLERLEGYEFNDYALAGIATLKALGY